MTLAVGRGAEPHALTSWVKRFYLLVLDLVLYSQEPQSWHLSCFYVEHTWMEPLRRVLQAVISGLICREISRRSTAERTSHRRRRHQWAH